MKKIVLIAVLYIIGWGATYPALLAQERDLWSNLPDEWPKRCRTELGFATGMALFPPAWLVAPFMTGFWEHGMQFTCPSHNGVKP